MKIWFYPLYVIFGALGIVITMLYTSFEHDVIIGGAVFFSLITAFVIEKIIPHAENLEERNVRRDLLFTLINLAFLMLVGPLTIFGFAIIFRTFLGTHTLFLSEQLGPIYLQSIICFFGVDLVRYWVHRAQHRYKWLWRFHSTHHKIRTVYFANNFYSHPLDLFLRHGIPAYLAALVGFHPSALGIGLGCLVLIGIFSHCNAEFKVNYLGKFITTNEIHRWHHYEEFKDGAKNFAPSLCLWDRVFGTYFN